MNRLFYIIIFLGTLFLPSAHHIHASAQAKSSFSQNIIKAVRYLKKQASQKVNVTRASAIITSISIVAAGITFYGIYSWKKKRATLLPNTPTNEFGQTPLLDAAQEGNLEKVQSLITQGANIEAIDMNQNTPLLLSALTGKNPEVTCLLIEHGANIHAQNAWGYTPLAGTASHGDLKSSKLLIEKGANAEIQNKDGKSALDWAQSYSQHCSSEEEKEKFQGIIRLIHFESKDKFGRTPLLQAAQQGNLKQVTLLVKEGANIDAIDKDGNSALDLATNGNYAQLAEYLQKAMTLEQRNARQKAIEADEKEEFV